ncbi:C2H2 transcription factor [Pleurostoma richardsiae]|uniref:C2H2 transcription factor n=1 Tax=Pleurostoma richardsiae TaxID=41990 RepID=A0AA38VHQ1_9PEZI|nr:C2H2 transcription factor [Pleurostoma richardsiae]
MAATFRSVNASLAPDSIKEETTVPTTPLPPTTPQQQSSPKVVDDAKTPTRATFAADAMSQQKPLPSSPFPQAVQVLESLEKKTPTRGNSQHSRKSRESEDVDMDESDGEGAAGDDDVGSDGEESVNADGTRSNKKKKSQRFYCTDYPPCNLSFTRSEHLARHIRKHTGERPFQCHCSRRFSRLDNLRQHAQTVHVNEDIPIDSLAATGTRFQRQIRTERVRQAGGRARASTAGSTGTTGRGHSKSLSTSSIASIGSIGSGYSPRDEARRRPPPLVMADPRSRLSLESYRSTADSQYSSYRAASPSDFSTPTSATFSTGQSSPHWGSNVASPTTSHSRVHSMYAGGSRTPGRRLSVPSGGNPFQSPQGANVGRPLFPQGPINSSNAGAVFSSPSGSVLASPTIATSGWSRRESASSAADEAWRRRTWHPDTHNFNGGSSRLSNVITPSQFSPSPAPLPAPNQGPLQNQQPVRLPGIESFDPVPHRPVTPPRRNPSPMMVDTDTPNPPTLLPSADLIGEDRRSLAAQWDMGLHRGLTRLEINPSAGTPPRDGAGAWANEVQQAVQAQAEQIRVQPTVRFEREAQIVPPPPATMFNGASPSALRGHQHTMSAPSASTPREMKRHGWYHGPVTVHEDRVMERGAHVDRMVHPNLANGFSGFPAREQPPVQQQPPQATNDPLRRLEALVAVATSEGSTATAY